jgi:hypothetical protein
MGAVGNQAALQVNDLELENCRQPGTQARFSGKAVASGQRRQKRLLNNFFCLGRVPQPGTSIAQQITAMRLNLKEKILSGLDAFAQFATSSGTVEITFPARNLRNKDFTSGQNRQLGA